MARPVRKGVALRLAADQSASTYPALRNSLRPRWRYARSGPHKTPGIRSRRFLNQVSEAPFNCQAIPSSPSRKHPQRPAVCRTAELLTPPLAFLWRRTARHAAGPPRRFWPACWRRRPRRHCDGRVQAARSPTGRAACRAQPRRAAPRAPWISCRRRYVLPRLLMPSSFGLPPVVNC